MPRARLGPRPPRRQRGVVLLVALILLLVLTTLGVTLARMQTTEERMASNEDNHQLAFQAAEAALRAAEDDLGTGVYANSQFNLGAANHVPGLYVLWTEPSMTAAPFTSVVNTVNWADPTATLPYRGPPLTGVPANAQQPTVVIELLPAVTIPACASNANSQGSVFRVTAHAFGGDGTAQATLQSVYFRC